MKKILIVYNPTKKNVKKVVSEIVAKLKGKYRITSCSSELISEKKCRGDLVLTLGGDGTILHVGHYAVKKSIPVLGINLGGLGYLAEFKPEEVSTAVETYFSGKIAPQQRAVLEVEYNKKKYFVINDCVIKSVGAKVINIELYINNEPITNIISDGIIVSTATGSTAYSLASGGSIVEPDAKVILITPICPHSLSNRPIIISQEKRIMLKVPKYKSNTNLLLSFDSQKSFNIKPTEKIELRLAERKLLFVQNPKKSFYTILKQKLGWGKR